MGRIQCPCGNQIYDSGDYSRNAARLITEQDIEDYTQALAEPGASHMELERRVFQCDECHRLIIFDGSGDDPAVFSAESSISVTRSILGDRWKGLLIANFSPLRAGSVSCNVNGPEAFVELNLSYQETKELYEKTLKDLTEKNLLRTAYFKNDGTTEHSWSVVS